MEWQPHPTATAGPTAALFRAKKGGYGGFGWSRVREVLLCTTVRVLRYYGGRGLERCKAGALHVLCQDYWYSGHTFDTSPYPDVVRVGVERRLGRTGLPSSTRTRAHGAFDFVQIAPQPPWPNSSTLTPHRMASRAVGFHADVELWQLIAYRTDTRRSRTGTGP